MNKVNKFQFIDMREDENPTLLFQAWDKSLNGTKTVECAYCTTKRG